jgi:ribulose-5-phosphate 4-epimerase/fuculose-1-phosphate aldolase
MSETTVYTDFRLHANHLAETGERGQAGFVIHGAIHATRENAGCGMHLHTEAQMALSTLPEGLFPLTQHAMRLYGRIDALPRTSVGKVRRFKL